MPVESTPVLRSVPAPRTAPSDGSLARVDVARRDDLDPVIQSLRGRVAALGLQARTSEQRAAIAESSLGTGVDDADLRSRHDVELDAVRAEVEARRDVLAAAVAAARVDAAQLVADARARGSAEVESARRDLLEVVAASSPSSPLPEQPSHEPEPPSSPSADSDTGSGPTIRTAEDVAGHRGPPAVAPVLPAPAHAPAPVVAPPTGCAPVLVHAADGTLQPAYLLGGAATPTTVYATGPVPVAPPAAGNAGGGSHPPAPAAKEGPVRRLLHADVVLPLLAVAIVVLLLLAWLG